MRTISNTVHIMFRLKVFKIIIKVEINIRNTSNYSLYIVTIFHKIYPAFGCLIFVDFQNEAASSCVNNSINKDIK